jgi:hypothetical protein
MKFYASLLLSLMASMTFANKPGINASFVEKEIINLAVGQNQSLDLKINYSADSIHYELQPEAGLDVVDLKQSVTRDNQLIIPLEIKVNQPGRYYLHLRITSVNQGVETKGVLSRIISSEADEVVQKKNVVPNKLRIMPVVETVKDAPHE